MLISQEKTLELVKEMQEKMKVTFMSTGFVPNRANKIISKRDREMKPVELVKVLEDKAKEGLEIYDFLNVMACMERQLKGIKVGRYRELNIFLGAEQAFIQRSFSEKMFDDLERKKNHKKEEVKKEEVEKEEVKKEEVKKEEVKKEEVKKEEVKKEEVKKEEVKEEEVKEEKQVTVESLLVFVE